jgi:N6-adenosine-specific RNA methylase IME4
VSYLSELEQCEQGYYRTIYADPPWWEKGAGKYKRGADRHYELMRTADICKLPVAGIAGEAAHLYLWATNNFLPDALKVTQAWGFRYITLITWTKPSIGIGQYFRGQTEHCIFAVRGRLPYKTQGEKRLQGSTHLQAGKLGHSKKPHEMYEVIERVSYAPRMELFARDERSGWDCWGSAEPQQPALQMEATA